MNSKVVFKKFLKGLLIINNNVFDYQVFRIINCHQKQPDLQTMVRLFFKLAPSWSGLFINLKKLFCLFYLLQNEALIGSNKKHYEIRLYFYKTDELPGRVILCLAITHLDMIGYLQYLYIRLLFFFLLSRIITAIHTLLKRTAPMSSMDEYKNNSR